MDLQNMLKHMQNQSVLVNGTRYQIDGDGIVRNVKPEDARKLLKNKAAWRIYTEGGAQPQRSPQKAPEPAKKAEMPKVAEKAPVAPEKQPDADSTLPDQEASAMTAAQDQFEARKAGEAKSPEEEAGEEPETGEEWPDPDMKMSKSYLQEMADAYEVGYDDKTTKKELVERITKAMYPDE